MRYVTLALAMLAVLALVGSAAVAQEQKPAGDKAAAGARGPRGGGNPFAALDLTAEQKAKVEETMKAAREKAAKAETPKEKGEIMKAAMDDVKKNVLTDEQRKKLESMPARGGRGNPLAALDLTAEQKAKVEEIMKAAREKAAKAETPKEKGEIMKAAMDDVKKNVLTEEQRKKLESMPARGGRGNPLAALDLTAEQKAKVEEIMKAAREKAAKAETPKEKGEIMKAAMDDVKKNVLTEEQRKKLESMPARGPGGRGGRGGAGAKGGAGSPPPPPAPAPE